VKRRLYTHTICPPASVTVLRISISVVLFRNPSIYTRTLARTGGSRPLTLNSRCRASFRSRCSRYSLRSSWPSETWWPLEVEITRSERSPIFECVMGFDSSDSVLKRCFVIAEEDGLWSPLCSSNSVFLSLDPFGK